MYKTILFATDLQENHYELCQKAVDIAKALGGDLHLLHVIEIPATLQWAQSLGFAEVGLPVKDEAKAVLNILGEALKIPPDHLHVEIGTASAHILTYIKKADCDLVILGNDARGAISSWPGSTGHAVSLHASCDVLTLRNELA